MQTLNWKWARKARLLWKQKSSLVVIIEFDQTNAAICLVKVPAAFIAKCLSATNGVYHSIVIFDNRMVYTFIFIFCNLVTCRHKSSSCIWYNFSGILLKLNGKLAINVYIIAIKSAANSTQTWMYNTMLLATTATGISRELYSVLIFSWTEKGFC